MPLIEWGLFASIQQWSTEAGRAALALLFVAGAIKCALILRRPTVSKLCVASLLLMFVALLTISATGYTMRFFQDERNLMFAGMTLALILFLVSLVTSIAGMFLWKAARPPHLQGIRQAISAAVFSPLGLLFAASMMWVSSIPVDGESLRRGSDSLFSGAASEFAPSHESSSYGYRVTLDPQLWQSQAAMKRELPGTSFAAVHAGKANMVILPVWLHGEQVPVEDLTSGMLSRLEFDVNSSEIKSITKLGKAPLKGVSIEAARNIDGVDFEYRMRIVEQKGFAYLLAAWKLSSAQDVPVSRLDSALDAVTFEKPSARLTSLSSEEQLGHALFFNNLGLHAYHSGKYKECLEFFRRAFEFQHTDPTMLSNVVEAYRQLGRNTEAIEYLEQHGQEFESNPDIGLVRAEVHMELGNHEEAISAYQSIFSEGYRNDERFIAFINLLIELERLDEATGLLDRYLANGESLDLNVMRAVIHRERGEYEQGIELLLKLQQGRPFSPEIAYELADLYDAAEQYQEEHEVTLQLLKNGYDNWYVYWLKALAEYGMHRYPEAKASLELALEANPTNENVKSYLDHVSGLLGQGDNSAVKTPVAPVAISESVLAEMATAALEATPEADAVYRRDLTAIEFVPGESYKTTREFEVEVMTRAGVDQFSTLEIKFDPLSERVFVNELVVRDARGEIVSRGDPATYYVVDQTPDEMATQDKVLYVPVSGLRPNHRVLFRMTRTDLYAPEQIPFGEYSLATGYPSAKKVFYLRAPDANVRFQLANMSEGKRTDDGWLWAVDSPPVYRYEQFQPPTAEFLPTLWLGSPQATWSNEVREYVERIQERLEPESEVAEIAKSLTVGKEQVADQVLSLVDYVQQQFTYRAIEFGVRGQIPQTAATTIRNRYGDCKDHSLLLHQLLKAKGIPSYLALVRSDGPIEKRIPSGDQFDHMILYVPGFKGGHFFDCTNKSGDLALTAPSSLAGHEALLVDTQLSEQFVRIPEYPDEAEHVDCRREIELLSSGDLAVRERVSVTGYWASAVRAYFRRLAQDERDEAMRRILASGGSEVTLEKHAIQGLDHPREPIVLWSDYRIKGAFDHAGGNLVGRLPSGWEREYLGIDYANSRLAPIKVKLPSNLHAKVRLKLPQGYVSQPDSDWNQQSSTPYVDCSFRAASDQAGVLVNYEVRGHQGTFAPDEFEQFYEASNLPLTLLKRNVVVSQAAGSQ